MTFLEMTRGSPGFKAYCRRRFTTKRLTHEQRFAKAQKARAADFRKFCKPRGLLSVLGEYESGAGETLIMRKVNGEFISSAPYREDEAA
jgi:hypothetical protein